MPCLETIIRNMYLKEDHMSGKTVIVMGKKGVVANKTGSDGITSDDEIYNIRFEDGSISTHPVRDMQMIGESVEAEEDKAEEDKKVTCPKCDGEGCEHCDDKGYHLESVELDERTSPLPQATAFAISYSYAGKDNKFVTKLTNIGGKVNREKKEVRFDFASASARTKFRKNNKEVLGSLDEMIEKKEVEMTEATEWVLAFDFKVDYTGLQGRKIVKDLSIKEIFKFSKEIKFIDPMLVYHFLDDWKAEFLRTYSHSDLIARASQLGLRVEKFLNRGLKYDVIERKWISKKEAKLMGEGELRYIFKKTNKINNLNKNKLPNNKIGSVDRYDVKILTVYEKKFKLLEKSLNKKNKREKFKCCHDIHKELLKIMRSNNEFNHKKLINIIEKYT